MTNASGHPMLMTPFAFAFPRCAIAEMPVRPVNAPGASFPQTDVGNSTQDSRVP